MIIHDSMSYGIFTSTDSGLHTKWFSYDLKMKICKHNKTNKRTEIKQFDWFIERIQMRVAFAWLSECSGEKTSCVSKNFLEINQYFALTSYRNMIGQFIELCLLHIRVFFGGKTKRPYFDLFIHWLIKQMTNTCRNQFSRSYKNRSSLKTDHYESLFHKNPMKMCWKTHEPFSRPWKQRFRISWC